ncbi:hypothetical protein BOTBODRAFT_33485 [Botryobasidium botryosum FD-172 SS1]|uniref:RRM domain-containing protein n=1 Tax=Botryobasidium botryosum (strain FD-172 SS1) TaxID=930990 RepID=A0A067MNL2_BOTB1|nr:hypothetical protein BOTBODRAFT_33485 [Botryobasidium botryosum FD-172 SS1]
MSLNDFLGDSTLGNFDWATEVDALPTAPSMKTDEERARERRERGDRDFGRSGGDYGNRDRPSYPPREELPLPTEPPYTAFVGNLAFDIIEADVEDFFAPNPLKSVKLIKDRDDKPKGFGYVEFETLDDLKAGLAKSGGQMANRTVRVSVAEPQRGGDDDKFSGNWRRDGPLPSAPPSRFGDRPSGPGGPRGGPMEGADPGVAETSSDWRSNRPTRPPPPPERGGDRMGPSSRGGSGFGAVHAPDTEEPWSIGSKFKPSPSPASEGGEKRGMFGARKSELGRDASVPRDEPSDWRRRDPTTRSPTGSTPATPQLSRRKLELLPRSATGSVPGSVSPSPVSSPKAATSAASGGKFDPFGGARPVDAASREKEAGEKIERDHTSWRRSSLQARQAPTPPESGGATPPPGSPKPRSGGGIAAATIRPTFSFAAAAGNKSVGGGGDSIKSSSSARGSDVDAVTEKISNIEV